MRVGEVGSDWGGGAMTEIYVIKQIDNSRLVKEVDFQRTKECVQLMLFGVFCLLLALFLCLQHFRVLRLGYETETLRKELGQLSELNQKLKLESAHLKDPKRITLLAKQLGLQEPTFDQIVVLQEPFPTEPTTTLVARGENVPLGPASAKQRTMR
jgi:cell division protein FtsL